MGMGVSPNCEIKGNETPEPHFPSVALANAKFQNESKVLKLKVYKVTFDFKDFIDFLTHYIIMK